MLTTKRLVPALVLVSLLFTFFVLFNASSGLRSEAVGAVSKVHSIIKKPSPPIPSLSHSSILPPPNPAPPPKAQPAGSLKPEGSKRVPISYDKTTPPAVGCEAVVHDAQQKILSEYQELLKGVRYANVWGYLETENKGDAAIWAAQQILLNTMGITFMEACRFVDKDCDIEKFTKVLEDHKPHSAIIMAGGGNFNDFYWEDQPSRIKMVQQFRDYPVRAFPQSMHITKPENIEMTKTAFGAHPDVQLAARDQPSFKWLQETFGAEAKGVVPMKVKHKLIPDIAFMWGSRPDFRRKGKKTHQVLILSRDDWEISSGDSKSVPMGQGSLELAPGFNVTYNKVDWKFTPTPGINVGTVKNPDGTETKTEARENGVNQRAWAKAIQGFEVLASADLVITDRLHGHIMSTIIGAPHILMDSKLGKNINYHDTWTKECGCTRVADDFEEAKKFARMFFEQQKKDQAWQEEQKAHPIQV